MKLFQTLIRISYIRQFSRILLWMSFVVFVSQSVVSQENYMFKKLTNNDGLSYSTVFDICQDSSGLIWFATKQGLNKYNSYDIQSYFTWDYPNLPSNIINDLCLSSDNELYLGTTHGLAKYNREQDDFSSITQDGRSLPAISTVLETSENQFFIGTTENGLWGYQADDNEIVQYASLSGHNISSMAKLEGKQYLIGTHQGLYIVNEKAQILVKLGPSNTETLPSQTISCIYKGRDQQLWIGTEDQGLFSFNRQTMQFSKIHLISEGLTGVEFVRAISEDHKGNLWVGTELGIFIYHPETDEINHIQHSLESDKLHLNDNAIYSLYLSREHIMWIGTYFGGVNYSLLENKKNFYHLYPGNEENDLKGKAVSDIYRCSRGNIWIGTEDGGICTFDPQRKRIVDYYEQGPPGGLSSNNIHAISEDKYGHIWLGHFTTGIDIFDPDKQTFTNVLPNPQMQGSFDNSVYAIYTDSRGKLWVGTRVNVKIYDYSKKQFVSFKPDALDGFFIYHIEEDDQGNMWFSTRYSGVIHYNRKSDEIVHYRSGTPSARGLSSNNVIASKQDEQGRIWFGTIEGGVNIYLPEKDSFQVISTDQGLPNNTVYGILEDRQGNMWLSTNEGISKYDYQTGQINNYTLQDGLEQMQFNFGSFFKDQDGTMYFGSIDGLTYFKPRMIHKNKNRPYVMLTDFKLFNESLDIDSTQILDHHINATDSIELKYGHNVFTINYSAINYYSPGNNAFSYYLEGFDKSWNHVGNKTAVTYTNLSPGSYVFHLKAANKDGLESSNTKTLYIHVLKPWYTTTLAFIVYGLIVLSLFLLYRRVTLNREKDKAALKYEKLEKNKIKALNRQRINFFTYISHEFKTPLSIIVAGIEELKNSNEFSRITGKKVDRIKRSTNRLSFLINQLMDFRKIESKHEKVVVQQGDIIHFIRETCTAFTSMFEEKEIDFDFVPNRVAYITWFDPDKMEKIVANLISNAIRFTPYEGIIRCSVDIQAAHNKNETEDKIEVIVTDNGPGISEYDLKYLFDQFHKGRKDGCSRDGTGIGLALVKSLVEYLRGTITVHNNEKHEPVFTVVLPADARNLVQYSASEGDPHNSRQIGIEDISYSSDEILEDESDESDEGDFHICIVEDSVDLANLLINHFKRHYRVSSAQNGRQALDLIQKENPDLVISDIMMPEMDGIELSRHIKSSQETSHISVVLLTAKTSQQDRMEGFETGAEAFISKPFDMKELDLIIRNILKSRNKLQESLLVNGSADLDQAHIHDKDKEFLRRSTEIIHENLGNENFSVETLASELGISTTLVYQKHKKLLDVSTSRYIQSLRFNKAVELMGTTDMCISEIAYEVGFSDPNYFSRAFKRTYQTTPSKYRNKILNDQKDRPRDEGAAE